jgi:hypothetical protein
LDCCDGKNNRIPISIPDTDADSDSDAGGNAFGRGLKERWEYNPGQLMQYKIIDRIGNCTRRYRL